jgi:hypothetical protein
MISPFLVARITGVSHHVQLERSIIFKDLGYLQLSVVFKVHEK